MTEKHVTSELYFAAKELVEEFERIQVELDLLLGAEGEAAYWRLSNAVEAYENGHLVQAQ